MSNDTNRMSDVAKGMKEGAVRQSVLTVTQPLSESLAESLSEKLGADNPMLAELAKVGADFFVLLVFAEGLSMIGSQLGGVIDDADEKSELLAKYLRHLAGSQISEEAFKMVMDSLPAVTGLFSEVKTEDLKLVLGESTKSEEDWFLRKRNKLF